MLTQSVHESMQIIPVPGRQREAVPHLNELVLPAWRVPGQWETLFQTIITIMMYLMKDTQVCHTHTRYPTTSHLN